MSAHVQLEPMIRTYPQECYPENRRLPVRPLLSPHGRAIVTAEALVQSYRAMYATFEQRAVWPCLVQKMMR